MYEPMDPLGSYQEEAIQFMSEREVGAIFLPMGVGKTFCAIEWIKRRKRLECMNTFPVVIFAPKIVCNSWCEEMKKFGAGLTYTDLSNGPSIQRLKQLDLAIALDTDVIITNYEMANHIRNKTSVFNTVIVDESTRIKNVKAKRSQAIVAIGKKASFRWILTGFPVTKSIMDVYGQILFLDHGQRLGTTYWQFLNRYCSPIQFGPGKRGWVPKSTAVYEIRGRITPIMFQRDREQCVAMPGKNYVELIVEPTEEQSRVSKEIFDYWRVNGREMTNALSVDMAFRQCSLGFIRGDGDSPAPRFIGSSRYAAIRDLINDGGCVRAAVWTNFRAEQAELFRVLSESGARTYAINGSTDHRDRTRYLQSFEKGNCDVLIISEQVGSFGLNELRDADISIYCSNSYDLELRKQSEDRIYRAGRRDRPTYYDIVTRDSIDVHILKLLKSKNEASKAFIRSAVLDSMEASL